MRKWPAKSQDLERVVEGWMRMCDVELIVEFPESLSEGEVGSVVKVRVLFDEVGKLFRGGDLIRAILVDADDLLGGIVIPGVRDEIIRKTVFTLVAVKTTLDERRS